MKKVIWIAGYGPNRSHDTLYSETFEREKDAKAFVAGQGCWRISRMEYTQPYSPGERTDEIGGVDVDKEIERIRRVEQCRTGRRVSTKQALALWQKSMRSGPGEARRNPAKKGREFPWIFSLKKTGASGSFIRRPKSGKKKTTPWRSVVKQLSHASNTALLRASLSPVWDKVSRGTAKSFFSYGVKKGDVPAWYTFPADVGQALIKIRGKSFQIHAREKTSRRGLMTIYYILRTR